VVDILETATRNRFRRDRGDYVQMKSVPPIRSHSTRYLAAAAYLDVGFRDRVLAATVQNKHQALAPAYGIHLATVVTHCVKAFYRQLIRDFCLAVLWLPLIFVDGLFDDIASIFRANFSMVEFIVQHIWVLSVIVFGSAIIVVADDLYIHYWILKRQFILYKFAFVERNQVTPSL